MLQQPGNQPDLQADVLFALADTSGRPPVQTDSSRPGPGHNRYLMWEGFDRMRSAIEAFSYHRKQPKWLLLMWNGLLNPLL